MKKIYITPETETVNCTPASAILENSLLIENKPSQDGEAEDAADEYRGSWEGIWDNM